MRNLVVLALLMAGPTTAVAANAGGKAAANVPSHIAYKIVADETVDAKRIVTVRVDARLSEGELASIAEAAKARSPAGTNRIVVNFLLGRPQAHDLPWATATFAPDLKIVVAGLSAADADAMTEAARRDSRTLVGTWLMGPPAAPGRLTIYRDQGKVFAEWHLRGGHRTVDELAEVRGQGQVPSRFDNRGDVRQNYVVHRNGTLELRDKSKVIASAEPIDRSEPMRRIPRDPAPVAAGLPNTAKEQVDPAKDAGAVAASVVVRALPVEPAPAEARAAVTVTSKPLMTPLASSRTSVTEPAAAPSARQSDRDAPRSATVSVSSDAPAAANVAGSSLAPEAAAGLAGAAAVAAVPAVTGRGHDRVSGRPAKARAAERPERKPFAARQHDTGRPKPGIDQSIGAVVSAQIAKR